MDELKMLATALGSPEPSQEAADRSRHRLQNTMRGGPVRKRRIGWLAGGLGLTAATAATAILVTSTGTTTTAHPNSPPSTAAQSPLSGRQILLAAATTAEKAPAASGIYWHVKTVYTKTSKGDTDTGASVIETWTRRDGRSWVREGSPTSPVKENGGPHSGTWNNGFFVGTTKLSFEQIQRLPADPTALKTYITRHSDLMRLVGKPVDKGGMSVDEVLIGGISSLLEMTPAPPAVRAAAFRALAKLPEVKNLGPVKGGVGLQISFHDGWSRMVLDPATSRLLNSAFGDADHNASGTSKVDAAEWTNTLPR
ncbi:CU044_5270 family protein [Actinoallomurus purpureus]|uniref:CU044_5270 family protein n=1 Tax=Actinoallomurus purpureus TaxID=478114 RepID=UPI0020935E2C|nr:CU044_5270 family protein [Actinoallomurus purpureus]MCO6008773.1 CU044_5270 family protein [Actinoallomurus purpureus]